MGFEIRIKFIISSPLVVAAPDDLTRK